MLGNYNLPLFWTDSNSKYIFSGKEIMKCDIHRDLHEVTVHNNNLGYSHITVIKILNDFMYKENVAGFIPRFTSRILYFFEICILKNQALSQLFIFESPSTWPFPSSESVNFKIRLTAKPFLKNGLYMSRKTNKFRIQGLTIINAWASFKWPFEGALSKWKLSYYNVELWFRSNIEIKR